MRLAWRQHLRAAPGSHRLPVHACLPAHPPAQLFPLCFLPAILGAPLCLALLCASLPWHQVAKQGLRLLKS